MPFLSETILENLAELFVLWPFKLQDLCALHESRAAQMQEQTQAILLAAEESQNEHLADIELVGTESMTDRFGLCSWIAGTEPHFRLRKEALRIHRWELNKLGVLYFSFSLSSSSPEHNTNQHLRSWCWGYTCDLRGRSERLPSKVG